LKQQRYLFFFWMAVCCTPLLAQTSADSLSMDSSANFMDDPVFTEYTYDNGSGIFLAIDTSFTGKQRYNPADRRTFPAAYLSNLGAPINNRFFEWSEQPGFRSGRNQFQPYQFHIDSLKYYRTTAPFTDISFLLGQNTEQWFRITQTQNFGTRANAAIDYERLVSVGYYQRERTAFSNFSANGWWRTKNDRYQIMGAFLYGDVLNQENGGLRPADLFTTYLGPPALADAWLTDATTDWKQVGGKLTQTYDWNRSTTVPDGDSSITILEPAVRLLHNMGVYNKRYTFQDHSLDRTYYGFIYEDSDTLSDISDLDGWYTGLSLFNVDGPVFGDSAAAPRLLWRVDTRYEAANLNDQNGFYNREHLTAGGQFSWAIGNRRQLSWTGEAKADVIQNDLHLETGVAINAPVVAPFLQLSAGAIGPDLLQQHYYGFNDRWDNDFADTRYYRFSGGLRSKRYDAQITLNYQLFNHYIFINSSAIPEQNADWVSVVQLRAEKTLHIGGFHLRNALALQQVTHNYSNQPIVPARPINLPVFLADASWYYEGALFNRALLFQAGLDTWWVSAYEANGYNPVTGLFYVQESDELSFYPVTDVFLNFDVKTFIFFVKMDNVTQGLFAKGYFEAPGYPMQNRSFKVGINWKVFY
jgi:hypothetical protein